MPAREVDKIALARENERKRYERERKKLIAEYRKKQRNGKGLFGDNIKLQEDLRKLDKDLERRLKRAELLATPRTKLGTQNFTRTREVTTNVSSKAGSVH